MWRVLDLFCGAGGAAMGLHRAWPDATITGVDINPQKNYPFNFVQADAMEIDGDWVRDFDFIWASLICKGDSCIRFFGNNRTREWEQQIPRTRLTLHGSGKPFVIENVPAAPLETDSLLCGQMFGLPLIRHRLFETNFAWLRPPHVCARRGSVSRGETVVVAGHGGGKSRSNCRLPYWTKANGTRALGIDWMTRKEMAEAVPPAYSEFIARQFRRPTPSLLP